MKAVDLCLVSLFSCFLFTAATSQDTTQSRPTIHAVRAVEAITIDGILSEAVWQKEDISGFRQLNPNEGAPETERTVVWIAYDDDALYVAARLYDSAPDSIVARLGRRDAELSSDWFYFAVDSYHDRRTAFYFGATPAGSIGDGTFYNDNWNDESWDGVWDVATKIDEKGWTVEMRVPYSQLRFHNNTEYVWGINFLREIQRRNEEDYFVLVPKKESGFVSRFADLVGIRDIRPPRRLEVLPYAVSSGHFLQHEDSDPFNDGSKLVGDLGADMKLGLGGNLTVDATINPDFGQVEVDPAVVNLSQYETFYQEKRPFFIEGASIFNFGRGGASDYWNFNWGDPDFFYSRRVGRAPQGSVTHEGFEDIPDRTTILGAAKLSGKIGEWSLGALSALTPREYGNVDSSGLRFKDEVEPLTYYGVVRLQREIDKGHRGVGFIGTSTLRDLRIPHMQQELSRRAFALGLDGWTFLDSSRTWVITGWSGVTQVRGGRGRILELQRAPQRYYQRPDAKQVEVDSSATSLSGWAGRVWVNKEKGNVRFNAAFGAISPGFETNDLGFHSQGDKVNAHVAVGYQWFDPGRVFRRKGFSVATFRNYNFGGEKTAEGYWLSTNAQFLNYWGFNSSVSWNPGSLNDRRTRGGPLMENPSSWYGYTSGYTDTRKPVVLELSTSGGQDESGGWSWSAEASIQWKPNSRLKVSFGPEFGIDHVTAQWVTRQDDPFAASTFGSRYVFASLEQKELSASIRLDWTFTPKLSLQVYLQPLISSGDYHGFKELARPRSFSFSSYGESGTSIEFADGQYTVDPDGGGPSLPFSFDDPDFNFKSLGGNAVLRWEYMPGSVLYFVWTQDRTNDAHPGSFRLGRDFSNLFSARANNIFLIKLTYWWSL